MVEKACSIRTWGSIKRHLARNAWKKYVNIFHFKWIISQDKNENTFILPFSNVSKWSHCLADWLIDREALQTHPFSPHESAVASRKFVLFRVCALDNVSETSNFSPMISSIMLQFFFQKWCSFHGRRWSARWCRKVEKKSRDFLLKRWKNIFQGDKEFFALSFDANVAQKYPQWLNWAEKYPNHFWRFDMWNMNATRVGVWHNVSSKVKTNFQFSLFYRVDLWAREEKTSNIFHFFLLDHFTPIIFTCEKDSTISCEKHACKLKSWKVQFSPIQPTEASSIANIYYAQKCMRKAENWIIGFSDRAEFIFHSLNSICTNFLQSHVK